jgi:hypothetical protein
MTSDILHVAPNVTRIALGVRTAAGTPCRTAVENHRGERAENLRVRTPCERS